MFDQFGIASTVKGAVLGALKRAAIGVIPKGIREGLLASVFQSIAGFECGCADKRDKLNVLFPLSEWIKPPPKLAIWTYADGDCVWQANGLARSLKQHGCNAEFHVWSPNNVPCADYCHQYKVADGSPEKRWWTFKLKLLREEVSKLDAEHFLWLDSDSICVRNPGDILRVMGGDPAHAFLEADMDTNPDWTWWGVKNSRITQLMRELASRTEAGGTPQKPDAPAKDGPFRRCYGVNGGAFIVRRDAIEEFCDKAMEFWKFVHDKTGTYVADEPALSYAVTAMSKNPESHGDVNFLDLWAREVFSVFGKDLPDDREWEWRQWFDQSKRRKVTPAIIHAQRCKPVLVENGKR